MKVIYFIGIFLQVNADQCYFRFKNTASVPIQIALRPQLHVRITTKKEFAVTPRSRHTVNPNMSQNVTYYCRDTFGEVQLGEITNAKNETLVKDQIFISTEKYEIVQNESAFKICRGECWSTQSIASNHEGLTVTRRIQNVSLKWPRNPLNKIQTFYKLNAPSEFIPAAKMNPYSFRIIQSCLNIRPGLEECLNWFKMEFNHYYKFFGSFDFVFVLNYTETRTIEGMLLSLLDSNKLFSVIELMIEDIKRYTLGGRLSYGRLSYFLSFLDA